MQVWETDLTFFPKLGDQLTLCLGYFDGVHLGHQHLVKQATKLGSNVAVLTFDRSPKPDRSSYSITPLSVKKTLFSDLGVRHLIVIQFLDAVKTTSKETFIHFLKAIGTERIVCGPDFTFGFKAQGTVKDLENAGFSMVIVPHLQYKDQKISTSSIVSLLHQGNVFDVYPLLGRFYQVSGIVGRGLGKGKTLGYPTANVVLDAPYELPKNGVYITCIYIHDQPYYSLASLGYHPTVANLDHPSLEVHVLNFNEDLYYQHVRVDFLWFIREEKKFSSLEALIQQMHLDKSFALKQEATLMKKI